MSVCFSEENQIFLLHTPGTTYAVGIVDGRYLCHVYYGSRLNSADIRYLLKEEEGPLAPGRQKREELAFLDTRFMEYPESGMGDYRESAFCVRSNDGYHASELKFKEYKILPGKPVLEGLPATWGNGEDCTTLKLHLEDELLGLKVCLLYTAFEGLDVITRSVLVENAGKEAVYLEKVLSACLDMENREFEAIGLFGGWARERHIQRVPVGYGRQNIGSFRGESSHQESPFMALCTPDTTQEAGEVYAMNFVYSGCFQAQVERSQHDSVRMTMGIHPEGFCWKLKPGETFTAPEVVMVYSGEGLGKMTRTFHDLYRQHLIRSPYIKKPRPILINNWEATYFNFDEKKLLEIAKEASRLGVELLVMDDGWFGKRNSDDCSLGDWFVNEEKLKGGLGALVENVKETGMKFGIWFEPEMVSPDSELFRAHPDWAIQIPGRNITESRAQYVLDIGRPEVADAVYKMVSDILRSTDISYVKWDMNRQLTTLGSAALKPDEQGEVMHRYMLGVYRMQERLVTDFPELLLENCSGGGGRFDPGMLYYSPQIWTSDNTDAVERLAIQEGTALVYPLSTMGAHVSVCPNHIVHRTTPFETRAEVAMAGTFGYELDITKLSEEEKEAVKQQTEAYHRYYPLLSEGDYYRLLSGGKEKKADSFMVVSKDKAKALLFYVRILAAPNEKGRFLRLKGLDAERKYQINGVSYTGAVLMNAGVLVPGGMKDFASMVLEITAEG